MEKYGTGPGPRHEFEFSINLMYRSPTYRGSTVLQAQICFVRTEINDF